MRKSSIALAAAFALALTGGFVAFAVLSFNVLHDEGPTEAGRPQGESPLPPVAIAGAQQTVMDWSEDGCSGYDYADLPTRAYRDASGRVHLIVSHFVNRRMSGPSLGRVRHSCDVVLGSDNEEDPARFNDREWIAAPYTTDGRTVYGLVHHEYQGHRHPGRCPSGEYRSCWYNAITLAVSRDGGRRFAHASPARHLVAASPYPYAPDAGTVGVFSPTNIVRNPRDGLHYALVAVQPYRAQRRGVCLIRTGDLANPRAWRAWDGSDFDTRFVDPYGERAARPADHVCEPVSQPEIESMVGSLTWNTHLDRWVLVGVAGRLDQRRGEVVWGVYYSTSTDLVSWEPRKLVRETELPWTYECGDSNPILYPSLLDARSASRNFETTGRRAWLYFTRFHYKNCRMTSNRDLVRVPVRFG